MSPLERGTKAPDFSLLATPDRKVALSDFAGKNVVLVFYPADWSPVCGDQLAVYNEILPMLKNKNAEVVGVSVDGVWSHVAYSKHRNLHFPLLADFEPKGEVARRYGVYRQNEGTSERALFVIDDKGVVHWSYVSPIGVNPGAEGILDALDSLSQMQRSSHDKPASQTTRPGL
jgi:peroxiredoxin